MIGQTISHYEITEKLGEGGMGIVYRAEDTRLRRPVALKFLTPGALGSEESRARFLREAQAAASLNHAGICTVHEIDEVDGRTFIVMECLEGQSLKDVIATGTVKLSVALAIAIEVADGLAAAHEKGIVHRDIKPGNVMIGKEFHPKIMDFGLARVRGSSQLTTSGKTMGTVAYMSPEQARGEDLDHRTDIWSLGVVLYEMVTGDRPFRGGNEQATIYSILNVAPTPVSHHSPGIPKALDAVIGRALAKTPARRYQSASELATALTALRRVSESSSLTSHHPAADSGPSIAVMPFVDMSPDRDQEYFCDGMAEEIINALTKVEGLRVVARTSAFAFKGKSEDIREIGWTLNARNVLEGSVRKAGNRLRITAQLVDVEDGCHRWSERYDRELEDVFAVQDEIAVAIVENLQIRLTSQQRERLTTPRRVDPDAYEAYLRGRHYLGRHYFSILRDPVHQQRVVGLFQRAIDRDPGYALAWAALAYVYSFLCRYVLRKGNCEKARSAATRALELDETLPEAHTAMGSVYLTADLDWDAARREHERAIELNPGSAPAHLEYGMHLVWEGWFDKGNAEMARALELDPFDYAANLRLGFGLFFARRYDDAVGHLRAMRDIFPGDEPIEQLMASCRVRKGVRVGEAIATLERLGSLDAGLGPAYVAAGELEKARGLVAEQLERRGRRSEYNLALLYAALGEKEEALDWLEKAHETAPADLLGVNTDADFDSLRSEPRFRELMQRAGIPSGQLAEADRPTSTDLTR